MSSLTLSAYCLGQGYHTHLAKKASYTASYILLWVQAQDLINTLSYFTSSVYCLGRFIELTWGMKFLCAVYLREAKGVEKLLNASGQHVGERC